MVSEIEPWVLLLQLTSGIKRARDFEILIGESAELLITLDDGSRWLLAAAPWPDGRDDEN